MEGQYSKQLHTQQSLQEFHGAVISLTWLHLDTGHTDGENLARDHKKPRLHSKQVSSLFSRATLLLRAKVSRFDPHFLLGYVHQYLDLETHI